MAVDGVLADTPSLRMEVLRLAMREVGLDEALASSSREPASIVAHEWAGAARLLAGEGAGETLVDLVALAAERAWRRALALGAPVVHRDAIARCHDAATLGWRVVLRADSTRRAAGLLLDDLAAACDASRVIAGDDVRVASGRTLAAVQYATLAHVLAGVDVVRVVEAGVAGEAAARNAMARLGVGWPAD